MQDNLLLLCFGTEFKNHIAEIRHLRFLWGLCVLENNLLDIKLSLGSFHQPPTPAEKLSALEKLVTTSWCRALLKASTFSLPEESTWDVGGCIQKTQICSAVCYKQGAVGSMINSGSRLWDIWAWEGERFHLCCGHGDHTRWLLHLCTAWRTSA